MIEADTLLSIGVKPTKLIGGWAKCRPKSSKAGGQGLTEHKDLLQKQINYFNIFSHDTHHILWEKLLSTKVSN
jgi:hypothetical protein